jgi:2-methylcitrate dehydratase PrpD
MEDEDIRVIELVVNPIVLDMTGDRDPDTGPRSKFSVFHAVAVALADGAAGPDEFSTPKANDHRIKRLRDLTRVRPDGSMRPDEALITITIRDGRQFAHHVRQTRGSVEKQLSDEELIGKTIKIASPIVGRAQATELSTALLEQPPTRLRDLIQSTLPRVRSNE